MAALCVIGNRSRDKSARRGEVSIRTLNRGAGVRANTVNGGEINVRPDNGGSCYLHNPDEPSAANTQTSNSRQPEVLSFERENAIVNH